jgi:phage portal protein BeeE
MTAMTFIETLTQWAQGWGNGYAEIQRNGRGDRSRSTRSTRAASRAPGRRPHGLRRPRRRDARRHHLRHGPPADPEDVFHIHGLGDGIVGYSVVRFAAESLGLGLAAQTFGAAFFGNGASMSGILEHPGKLDDKARKNLRECVEG